MAFDVEIDRIFGKQYLLHNKNETRAVAPAERGRILLTVSLCF
jgi:hypothetical protein